MNFKKRVNGSWTDIPHYIHNTSTDTITTLPADLYADGNNATVGLKGNMYQASGVSPTTPIQPQECGERTGNLFSSNWEQGSINATTGNNQNSDIIVRTAGYIPITYNVLYSMKRDKASGYMNLRLYDANKNYIGVGANEYISVIVGTSATNPMGAGYSFCVFKFISEDVAYIRINDATNDLSTQYMMVEGEYTEQTMPSYEPYGYKIPILSANTTTPVYLGEVESTRKIKKLVLTGQENWQLSQASGGRYRFVIDVTDAVNADTSNPYSICSHLPLGASGATYSTDDVYTIASGKLYMRLTVDYNSIPTFKAYLSDQYAAGTPVCVWYVLATPQTAIVNEPIRKIGEYADTVSGITIPTIAGADTLSVDTTLQPSEVTVNYHGWHPVADVHEADNGAWD